MTALTTLRAADLIYDDATHTSTTPDGRNVPHVTHILKSVGVAVDFEELRETLGRDRAAAIVYRRELGRVVHADAHAYDDGDLAWSTVAPASLPFLDAWATFRVNLQLEPISRERRIYHPIDDYTGMYDGRFLQASTGKHILVDIKLGDPDDAGGRYQLAAYDAAHLVEHPSEPNDERWGVQLLPHLKQPYRIFNYSDRRSYPEGYLDFQKFKAFCVTYRAQAARRRAA